MKKIMFNDKYGLTRAVLEGRKTMTRRIVSYKLLTMMIKMFHMEDTGMFRAEELVKQRLRELSPYKIGEEIAIAQSYLDAKGRDKQYRAEEWADILRYHGKREIRDIAGCGNKMFVAAQFMPHRIRITNVKVERLQDISYVDTFKEGITKWQDEEYGFVHFGFDGLDIDTYDRKEAFAALIDRISGKGTWDKNPLAFAYEFQLIK